MQSHLREAPKVGKSQTWRLSGAEGRGCGGSAFNRRFQCCSTKGGRRMVVTDAQTLCLQTVKMVNLTLRVFCYNDQILRSCLGNFGAV